jgi:flagellar hook-basal body complex protein FliE
MSVAAVGGAGSGFGISGALATDSPARAGAGAGATGADGKSFGDMVQGGLEAVSQQEFAADDLVNAMASGQDVSIHEVMTATTKANLSIDLLVQVRNKAVEAYREIMNMQV